MKKIAAFILLFCIVFSFASCGGNGKKPSGNEDPETADLKAWAFHSFEKTVVNTTPKGSFETDYTVYLAKGETEGCQVAIYPTKKINNATLTLASGGDESIEIMMYVMSRSHTIGRTKQYTDSLIPYYGRKLIVEPEVILPFMIEFKTTKDTPAGEYKHVFEFKNKEGEVLATYNITVHVWDIILPEEKTFATAVGMAEIAEYGAYESWYNTVLDHNMSAYNLPFDILSDSADAYMSDPRVTSFKVPIPENEDGSINETELLKYYEKLKSNETWLKKAYFYPLDEPRTKQMLDELKEWEEKLTALCPEIEICAPFYTNIPLGGNTDQTDHMADYTDLWCPKLCLWDDERSYGDFLDYTPSKSFEERMNEQIAKGDRMWSYVCNDPDDPYAQMFIDTEGVHQRLMFWQMYQRDIDGFLYWSVNFYGHKEGPNRPEGSPVTLQDPWKTVNTNITNGDGKVIYGCGFLFYPGMAVGAGGAVPSIRAKIVRDGVDDIELLYLAEQYLGEEWLKNKTKEGTPSLTEFVSGDEFIKLRIEIGNALEAALNK